MERQERCRLYGEQSSLGGTCALGRLQRRVHVLKTLSADDGSLRTLPRCQSYSTILAVVLASTSPPRSSRPPARASCARKSSGESQLFSLYARRCARVAADVRRL